MLYFVIDGCFNSWQFASFWAGDGDDALGASASAHDARRPVRRGLVGRVGHFTQSSDAVS